MPETTISKGKLTPQQEKFVFYLIQGKSQRQAYYEAYPNSRKWQEKSVDSAASNLLKNNKVAIRYYELLKKAENEAVMSAADRQKWLSDIVKTGMINVDGVDIPVKSEQRLKAMDILNKMSGEYITKIETTDEGFNINISIGYEKES